MRDGAHGVVRNWHLVLLVYLLLFLIAPFDPTYPEAGLDPSWRTGLNEAVAQHLAFGRDVVFTYGPYAAVSTGMYHPQLPWLGVGGGLLLAAGYAVAALVLLRDRRRWVAVALSAALMTGLATTDSLSLLYPMLAALAVHRIVTPEVPGGLSRSDHVRLAVLAVPFGLLPLVKLSSVPVALVGLGAASLFLAMRGRRLAAAAFWVLPALTTFVLWLVAGQQAKGLGGYVVRSLPMVSGYTEAMSLSGNVAQAQLVGMVSGLVLLTLLARSSVPVGERLLVTVLVGATLFVAFKAALVRHDTHALIIVAPLVVTGLVAASYCRGRVVRVTLVVLCLGVALPMKVYWTMPIDPSLGETVWRSLVSGPAGLAQRVLDPGLLDRRYAEALAEVREENLVPRVPAGTDVDLYPFEQAGLLAQGVEWNPRPVFQSYGAWAPSLLELNADHLRGSSAPDTVLFGIEPIDGRLPALEDGASWVPLLENYRIAGYDAVHDYLVMKHREPGLPLAVSTRALHLRGRLGQPLALPGADEDRTGQGWLVRFDVQPTTKGRLSEIVWKTSQLRITLTLDDGRTRHYRFVPRMARSQFLLSPLVRKPREMAGLVFPEGTSARAVAPQEVREIRLDVRGASGMWKVDYSVDLISVRLPVGNHPG